MNTIFIPVDFSGTSNAALRLGIHLATDMKCRLLVAHAYSLSVAELRGVHTENELDTLIRTTERKILRKMLAMLLKTYKLAGYSAIPLDTECLISYNGKTAESIIEQATIHKAKLIVMGTHGMSGIKKLLLGSTTNTVIKRSPIPVLAVPAGCRKKNIRQICLASDLLHLRGELRLTRPLARGMQADITVLHMQYGHINEFLLSATRKLLRQKPFADIRFSSIPATLDKKLNDQIRNNLTKTGADALLMFPHKKGFWHRLMVGSKTGDMAAVIKIPLLSLRLN